jgi:DNA-binding XRE family transcriptional regulator
MEAEQRERDLQARSDTMQVAEIANQGIGGRLREERLRLGFSQTEMAAVGGVSRTTQVNYEIGKSDPTLMYLNRIWTRGADRFYVISGTRSPQVSNFDFDWEIASPIMFAILDWESKNRSLSKRARWNFFRLAYSFYLSTGQEVMEGDIRSMLDGLEEK